MNGLRKRNTATQEKKEKCEKKNRKREVVKGEIKRQKLRNNQ